MADISVTPASVQPGTDADYYTGTAGETVTAGQPLYLSSTDNRLYLADCNASLSAAAAKGIALHGASAGQPVTLQTSGSISIGGTTVAATVYVVSDTAGGIMPTADLDTAGMYCTVLGVGGTSNTIKMSIFVSNQIKV